MYSVFASRKIVAFYLQKILSFNKWYITNKRTALFTFAKMLIVIIVIHCKGCHDYDSIHTSTVSRTWSFTTCVLQLPSKHCDRIDAIILKKKTNA